ncbi:MAG: S9 family peptidase [Longimicrobiales bacterium]
MSRHTRGRLVAALFLTATVVGGATAQTPLGSPVAGGQAAKRAMTSRDLWSLTRVGDPALSPDSKTVAYTQTRYDLTTYKSKTDIWAVPATGGEPTQRTRSATGSSNSPAWSPDGKLLAFVSSREAGPQVWVMPAGGGDARKLTALDGGVSGPLVWSRDGTKVLFTSGVKPAGDELASRLDKLATSKSEAKIYDEVGYRHWDEWEDGLRSHVFVLDIATQKSTDVTPGAYDAPPIALGGFLDYDISPDNSEIAFVRNTDAQTMVGTGNDVWLAPTNGGEAKRLTESRANDVAPHYSPDGRYIAYLAMVRPGFESDRARISLYDRKTGQVRTLTEQLDLSPDFFQWSADSKSIWFLAPERLNHTLHRITVATGAITPLSVDGYNNAVAIGADGKTIVVARQSAAHPVDLYAMDAQGKILRQLTHANDALLGQLALQPAEPFWFEGAEGQRVQGFIVKPPNFDATRKYPVVLLIHGGPQGAWGNSWSYRWNPNMFTAPGYVAVLVNPRGSTGYGQKFTDEISGDWGGKVYTDIMNGLDHALAVNPFMDKNRLGAAGASYGGYMINWINGHTDRFDALITHDGIYDTRSMYGATEELWFPEWEYGGTPWENPAGYEKWNPAANAKNMSTPLLVVHGGLDYRVPLEQGLAAFTTMRRRGLPSRLLYFPDEGHWVLKPANAMVWWDTMLGWLETYLKPKDATE